MVLDFSFYLFLAVVFTGTVWLVDHWILAPRRSRVFQNETQVSKGVEISRNTEEPILVEYSKSFFPVLLIVFLIRGFMFEPFRIPSGSMLPTLYIGDFILVNKFSYGVKVPVLNKEMVAFEPPERGDIVVFRFPRDPNVDYIKRVVGLPGDHIAYYNKELYVNGTRVEREFIGQYQGPGQTFANEYVEKMDDSEHSMLLLPARPNKLQGEWIVPDDKYFVMGDNRDNSNDSRVWGAVPKENLLGKAVMIWMHFSDEFHFERLGTIIK